jgi:hypothetical protein
MPGLTGDVTSTAGTVATTLASVVSASTCGDTTHSCGLTYDAKGRITAATNNVISGGGSSYEPKRVEEVNAAVLGGGSQSTIGIGSNFSTSGTSGYVAGTSTESVMQSFATATTLNADANWFYSGGGTMTLNYDITWKGRFGYDNGAAGVTNTRAVVGMHTGASGFNTNAFPISADTGLTGLFFRCSSSVPDTNWTAVTYNGTTQHTSASSIPCSTTKHTFKIVYTAGVSAAFSIDGAAAFYTMSTAADLPSGIAAQFMGVRNLTAGTARNAYMGFMLMEGN